MEKSCLVIELFLHIMRANSKIYHQFKNLYKISFTKISHNSAGLLSTCPEVGIYKRKQGSKRERKHAFA